jgi:branched-chain amino acid transport system permease protein
MNGLTQILASSIATGALYALLLFGILIVYRVSKAVNFAHGALGMVSAFVTYGLATDAGWPQWIAIVAGLSVAAVISFATDRFVLEPISR